MDTKFLIDEAWIQFYKVNPDHEENLNDMDLFDEYSIKELVIDFIKHFITNKKVYSSDSSSEFINCNYKFVNQLWKYIKEEYDRDDHYFDDCFLVYNENQIVRDYENVDDYHTKNFIINISESDISFIFARSYDKIQNLKRISLMIIFIFVMILVLAFSSLMTKVD